MSTNPLNDISKVYLDQIAEKKKDDSYLETDMKKRQANNEKARKELAKGPQMKNPHFEETQMEGVRDTDPEKGTKERKARLEKKRGMKLDDHPQYTKEELEASGLFTAEEIEEILEKMEYERDMDHPKTTRETKAGDPNQITTYKHPKRPSTIKDKKSPKKMYPGKYQDSGGVVLGRKVRVGEALDPVGKEDGDVDNDGDKDSSDKYLLKRRKAIGKAMKKRLKEERESLSEVMDDTESQKTVKEKKVNNKVTINPKLGEAVEEMGGTLIEAIEIDEMDYVIESVYDELIEEGFSVDDVEFGIETALNTLDEASDSYYDSAVKSSKDAAAKIKGEAPKKSLKDRVKSAAKKAIFGAGRAVGQAAKAKAAVQAAPGKAKSAMQAKIDKVKRIAKAGYKSGRGPVEKKPTTYRGAGAGRKEKVTEAVYGGEPEKKKDTRMVVTNADKKANTPAYQKFKAGDKRYKAADHMKEGVYGADSSMRKAAAKERAAEKKAGSKAKSPGRLGPSAGKSYADHEAHSIKAHDKITKKTKPSVLGMTSEDADLDKMQKDADANRARAAKLKDRNVTRASASFAAAKVADDVKKAARTGPQQHKGTRTGVMRTEEASMSPQELMLQKKKARIDKMIAMKRQQGLAKQKAGDAQPAKAMGEATEDSLRDRRMERGGVDGNVSYDKAPKFAPGPAKKSSGSDKAIDFVRKEITAKYGKGALIDTKKK